MTKTRNNHYVPQWYQEGFIEPGQNTYSYLDLSPPQHALSDGGVVSERSKFISPTSRAFCQRDLYSTFFGTSVNDEIERKLFGDIDTRGAHAVRAFVGEDASEWHHHFTTFFEYLDIQKIRTPKGLDWLSAQYPRLSQNDLMFEMQGIRTMHCTIWTEGVREIVSAQDADVKFIVSDHPVTIYNYAAPPGANGNSYPRAQLDAVHRHLQDSGSRGGPRLGHRAPRDHRREDQGCVQPLRRPVAARDKLAGNVAKARWFGPRDLHRVSTPVGHFELRARPITLLRRTADRASLHSPTDR